MERSDDKPTEAAARTSLLELFSKHFAAVSTVIGFSVILMTTVFLYGYLSVFDSRLIWIIEYSDILKFALVVFAVLSGLLGTIRSYGEDALRAWWGPPEQRSFWIKLAILVWFFSFVPLILKDETSEEHFYLLHIATALSVLLLLGLILYGDFRLRRWRLSTANDVIEDLSFLTFSLFLFGFSFGVYMRDGSSQRYDAKLKGQEDLKNAMLVLVTPHHTILYTDKEEVVVVPSADLAQLIRRPTKPAK